MITRRAQAFTLVELLISMSILIVMVVMLTNVFGSTSSAWLNAESKNDRNRTGRTLTDLIGRELRGAMLPVETTAAIGNPNLQMLINPPVTDVPVEYQNPHSLFWQAPLANEQSFGEIAEVGYFVRWIEHGTTATPSLMRFFVNPSVYSETQQKTVANPDFLIYQEANTWLKPSVIARVAPGDKASGYAGLVAENVVGFWVRNYGVGGREITTTADSTTLATSFDSRTGYEQWETAASGQVKKRRYLPFQLSLSLAQFDTRHADKMGTAWRKVRTLANDRNTGDAVQFLDSFRTAAGTDAELSALLPGLRIYHTQVILDNAR